MSLFRNDYRPSFIFSALCLLRSLTPLLNPFRVAERTTRECTKGARLIGTETFVKQPSFLPTEPIGNLLGERWALTSFRLSFGAIERRVRLATKTEDVVLAVWPSPPPTPLSLAAMTTIRGSMLVWTDVRICAQPGFIEKQHFPYTVPLAMAFAIHLNHAWGREY